MRRRIGINLCPYAGGHGGAETYLANLVTALSRVLRLDRICLFIAAGMEGRFSGESGFEEIVCGRAGQSRGRRVFLEQTLLPKLTKRHGIDVIFSNYVSPVRARCRQIVNVHDMLYRIHPDYIPGRTKLWYWRTMVPASIRRAETVLTVSRRSADDIRRFFPAHAHKVVVGSQAVSYELARMDSAGLDSDVIAGMGVTEPFLLCTTGLDRHKNISGLLRGFEAALQHDGHLSLVLTDPQGRRHADGVNGLDSELQSRIVLAGCVGRRELAALYRRAVAHATASYFEGFGQSIIEAQYFGCPNITSLACSLPEVAGDAALYFHPDDSSTLASHIAELLHNGDRRKDLVARGLRNVRRFNWEAAARQLLDLCDRAVEQPRVDPGDRRSFHSRGVRTILRGLRDRTRNGRIRKLPLVNLMPHSGCNCRCVMCDVWKGNAARSELSVETIQSWRTAFEQLGVQRVMLTGGEPLMHGQFERLIGLLHELGIRVTLLSSGLLLKKYARPIVASCAEVVVSLDGTRESHDAVRRVPGAFEKLADGVEALHELDPSFPVTGRCTMQRINYRDWLAVVDAAREIGLQAISFQAADVTTNAFAHPHGWSPEQVEEVALPAQELPELEQMVETVIRTRAADIRSGFIAEDARKLRRIADHYAARCGRGTYTSSKCNVPYVSAVIEADGSVRPCFFHRCFGNVNDASLTEILNSEEMVKFRKTLRVREDPICRRCVCALYYSPGRFEGRLAR